jgi:hypothetical protein
MAFWDTYATHMAIVVSGMVEVLMTFFGTSEKQKRTQKRKE